MPQPQRCSFSNPFDEDPDADRCERTATHVLRVTLPGSPPKYRADTYCTPCAAGMARAYQRRGYSVALADILTDGEVHHDDVDPGS